MQRRPAGWKVERTPPPPLRRTGRRPDQEAADVIAEALRTGQWLSKVYGDMAEAKRAVKRLRYQAGRIDPALRVRSRRLPDGDGVKLSIQVTREGKQ